MTKVMTSLYALKIGDLILKDFREYVGHEEYDKLMSEPIKGCSCGFIKEGDENICPKCEVLPDE